MSKHPECQVAITVLPTSQSGEHKVKVLGLFVSADDDWKGEIATQGVIDGMNWWFTA